MFDLDGTLVEFKLKVKDAKREIISRLKDVGVNVEDISEDDPVKTIIQKIRVRLSDEGKGCIDPERVVFDLMEKYEIEASKDAVPRKGVDWTLKKLRSMGMLIIVATNSCRNAAKIALGRCNLMDYIDFLVTRDDVENIKPADDIVRKSLELAGISYECAVYVGDSTFDIDAAKSAGVTSVAILGGVHTEEKLRSRNPDYVLSSIEELIPKVIEAGDNPGSDIESLIRPL